MGKLPEYHLNNGWADIVTTVFILHRRRAEYGLLDERRQTISDADLNDIISELRSTNPHVGESLVTGRLRSLGYYVVRDRVRNALQSSDLLRWPGVLTHRRPYSVAGPNSLWHIGNDLVTSHNYSNTKFVEIQDTSLPVSVAT